MTDLPKAYEPAAVEPGLYEDWWAAGLFHAEPDDDGEPFAIVIPPPNVTGSLHVGHALDNTIQDVIIRRERMLGRNAVWIPGMDHAGIATQMVVEKQLTAEGLTRHDLGREAFIDRVWAWKETSGGAILNQLRVLGCSLDWDREAFTFDEPRNAAVTKVFVELYEQGLIYRGARLINWDPVLHTALSDIEVEHEEVTGELVHFRYPFAESDGEAGGIEAEAGGIEAEAGGIEPEAGGIDGEAGGIEQEAGGIVVATTRAETMLGDTAIAVHPDDERYRQLVGRHVRHPFLDRTLPVVADDYVDPEFGSGAVKITPAHDPNDYELGLRHDLPMIDIMDDDAVLNDEGGRFAGMGRFDARVAVKHALEQAGLLVKVEPHVHQVGHSSRSASVIEPRLSDQWFVEVRPLADKAIAAVQAGEVRFVPERLAKPFVDWLENLHDWCISRQLWWGHRIPAWHHETSGEIRVSATPIDEPGWVQDPDVLDTWFSSQLWPFSVFGWPDETPELATWYPTSTLVTGYDINTFWVSRMLMIGLWFTGEVPFHVVHNHGLVRDESGKKMSKSFGNVIDPLDLIAKYGADATRFALLRSASPGTDVPLAEEWVEGERKFTNKLWNVVGFALSNLGGVQPGELPATDELSLDDRWVLSRLQEVHVEADAAYARYDWALVVRSLRSFVWDELADWYLEAVKLRIYGGDPAAAGVARRVLASVIDHVLRLLHPVMPFVTETLWRALTGASGGRESLMVAPWPGAQAILADPESVRQFEVIKDLVTEINRFRSQNAIKPSARFPLTISSDEGPLLSAEATLIGSLATLSEVVVVDDLEERPGTSTIVFGAGRAQVELAGLIDVDAEVARLEKERSRAEDDLERVDGKLANTGFVERAPAEVVERERAKRDEAARVIVQLGERLEALASLRG
jgi:valyl-tRNA synthetase